MRRVWYRDVYLKASAPLHRWLGRKSRADALRLYADHGLGAVDILREQIAACPSYRDRRRLYRMHDEIARRFLGAATLGGPGAPAAG